VQKLLLASLCLPVCLSASVSSSPTINKDNYEKLATVVDLGYSDHEAQILCLNVNTLMRKHKNVKTRQLTERSVEEFKCLLKREPWETY
jgi:hypothetical protein